MSEAHNNRSAWAHSIVVSDSAIDEPGSPTWWISRPADPDPGTRGPGRPPLGLRRIIDAGIEILDDEGIGALSMRTLATRLGSGTATLYRHVNSKDELLAYITDRILSQTDLDSGAFDSWQHACRAGARALYTTLTAHPNAIPLFVKQVPVGPGALAARERGIAVLLAARFPPQLAARGYTTLAHFVIGFAIQQHIDETGEPERARRLSDYYRTLDPQIYPATTTVSELLPGTTIDEEFEFGLNLIIDGLHNALRHAAEHHPLH